MATSIVTKIFAPYKNIIHRYDKVFIVLRQFSIENKPLHETSEKLIKVAIIGAPNAGKSTMINQLLEKQICATSKKVHTTKSLSRAICNFENTQIVFLDTPGIVNDLEIKKYNLVKDMDSTRTGLNQADIIGVLHDVSNVHIKSNLNNTVIELLEKHNDIPSFLILNKIDLLKSKSQLLELVRILTNNTIAGNQIIVNNKRKCNGGYAGFSDVFMISALEGDGTETIKEYLVKNAKHSNWIYSSNNWTDQEPVNLILNEVRAKLLDFLPQELPYKLKIKMEHFEEGSDKIIAVVNVTCPNERKKKFIVGAGRGRWRIISDKVRSDLTSAFQKPITVILNIKAEINKDEYKKH